MVFKTYTIPIEETIPKWFAIALGVQHEDGVRTIVLDMAAFREAYGSGVASVRQRLFGRGEFCAVSTEMDGDRVLWELHREHTQSEGAGEIFVSWFPADGGQARSVLLPTSIYKSGAERPGQVPPLEQGWYDHLVESVARAEGALSEAAERAREAEEKHEEIIGALERGEYKGEKGEPGRDGAPGRDGKDGKDGAPGKDGASPAVSITEIPGGHRITITDADGEHSADVMDGAGGDVKDVQVAGTSVVQDGVANVPFATKNVGGAVRPWNGLVMHDFDGRMCVYAASNATIDSRVPNLAPGRNPFLAQNAEPIVPGALDYAVKAAMCDGQGPAWTPSEKQAAQTRIGIVTITQEEYDLLESPDPNTYYAIVEADT